MIDQRLRVLRTVAEAGTVTAAARWLGYTPSAVSHQLKSLAKDLDIDVLEQQGRGVRLTAAGRLLLEQTQDLFTRWEEIRSDLASIAPHRPGHRRVLRVCGFSTAAAAFLPAVAQRVMDRFAESTVTIIEADPEECFELLLTERADIAVVVATDPLPPRSDARFVQRALLSDPLDLLVPADHRLAGRASVLLEEAAEEDWIMDKPGSPYYRLVRTACGAAGFFPEVAHQCHEWETGAALVSLGLGVSLIPRLAKLPAGYSVMRVPVRGEPVPAREILTGIRAGSADSPMIAGALEVLAEVAAGFGARQR